jgi:hypothetical protein
MTKAEYALMQFLDRGLGQPSLFRATALHKAVVAEARAAERETLALFVRELWENGVPAQEFADRIRALIP